jgi:hypothetical protein
MTIIERQPSFFPKEDCLIYIKKLFKPRIVIQAFNSSTGEAEAKGSGVFQGQPRKH